MVLTVQKSMEISQLQITDKVTDVPVVSLVQVPRVWVVKKTVEDPQFEIAEKTVENPETQFSDVVIDACLTCDAKCMVACETCVKDNMFMVAGEITVTGKMDDCDELVPELLNFVKGVVIKKTLVKKCLEMTRGSFVQGGAQTEASGSSTHKEQGRQHRRESQR